MRRPGLLSHPEDIHCVVFHLLVVAAYTVAFWIYLHPDAAGITGPLTRIAFVAGAALMLGWISGVNVGVNFHNHVHRPIFTVHWLNRWFGRLWTVTGGWPSYFWRFSHLTVHHASVLQDEDWTLPRRKADGSWESVYRYTLLHWPWRYSLHLWRDFRANRGGPGVRRRAWVELLIFVPLYSIPFWIDPVMALGLWVLPHFVANAYVMGPGMYAQHAGCEAPGEDDRLTHSNTFVSPLFNLTMFNIGYHIEHHQYPFVHWSELPRLHARLRPELIRQGAHVVPFGYYHGGKLLASSDGQVRDRFFVRHPDYGPEPETPSNEVSSDTPTARTGTVPRG